MEKALALESVGLPASKIGDTTRELLRGLFLFALLAGELITLSSPLLSVDVHRTQFLLRGVYYRGPICASFVTAGVVAALLSWRTLVVEVRTALAGRRAHDQGRYLWLGVHLIVLFLLIKSAPLAIRSTLPNSVGAHLWIWIWTALALLGLLSWAAALLPLSFWMRWMSQCPAAFLVGAAFSILVRAIVHLGRETLWAPLQSSTLAGVWLVLRLLQPKVVVNAQTAVIGTARFSVWIAPACSGIEAIVLILVLLTAYLWFYQRELRFPQALLLLPLGAATMWLFNIIRVAALIELGGWRPEVALNGFHSVAGWLFFNLVACGIVVVSRQLSLFATESPAPAASVFFNPAAPYLVPLLTIMAIAMITGAFSSGFDLLYPARVLGAIGALSFYRKELIRHWASVSPWALVIGGLTFLAWIWLRPHGNLAADTEFAKGLRALSPLAAVLWILVRTMGAVVTVPIAEEMAFRGYLLRKLVCADFQNVPVGEFSWLSFGVSSILFGMLHYYWLAGTLAGALFAIALYRHRRLSDAIAAHAITNALLAAYVLLTRQWSLWN
jgi:exosortase E/protease (VPEID-CTERM system)